MTARTRLVITGRGLLGAVLKSARETVDRSPEQVGNATGISGRTVRRLEEGAQTAMRPRPVTLDALAGFYGLRAKALNDLAELSDCTGQALVERVRDLAEQTLGADAVRDASGDEDEVFVLAMRMARQLPARTEASAEPFAMRLTRWAGIEQAADAEMVGELLEDLLVLDRRRLRLAADLVAELRAAREQELRSSDG
jgi:transcriptional regulator with XRE-family HTH domain